MSRMSKRVDRVELLAKSASGTLEPTVYGIIDRVDNVDGVLVPNVLRAWKGTIGKMEATNDEPSVFLVEKLEPFILN